MKNVIVGVFATVFAVGALAASAAVDPMAGKAQAALARYQAWKGADETVVFPIVTDLHDWHPDVIPGCGPDRSAKMYIPSALRVGEYFGADFVADLGDMGSDYYWHEGQMTQSTAEVMKRRWKSQFELYEGTKLPVLCCVGNHDLCYCEGGKYKSAKPSEFGAFFSPLAHGAEVVWGNGRDYGYWDVPGKRTRIIVLDTFELRSGYGLSHEQLKFLASALQVPEDFTVVAIMHAQLAPAFGCWLDRNGVMRYRNHCNGFKASCGYREAVRMFEDYLAHGKGTVGDVSWDFSHLKRNRLAGLIGGHSHYDNAFRLFDVLHIVRQGFGSLSAKKEMPHENGARHTEVYLPKDTAIDVCAVKPKTGELAIFRIGAGDEKADFKSKGE